MSGPVIRTLLLAGVAVPIAYFANLVGWAALTPKFDHNSMMPSEVGRDGQAYAAAFNAGLIGVAALSWVAAAGVFLGLRRAGAPWVAAAAPALLLAAGGFALGMAGAFPLPHPLHFGFGLNLATPFVPLAGAIALNGPNRWILGGLFLAQFLYPLAVALDGVTDQTVGFWVRYVASVNFLALAYFCLTIRARIRR